MKDVFVTLKQLDQQLLPLKEHGALLIPKQGWVRTIRKALGMTIKQLAKRLQVTPSRVVKIEMSEHDGAVTLHTMQTVAEAMDCVFVYQFLPRSGLEAMLRERAKTIAAQQLNRTAHTMDLEAQAVQPDWLRSQTRDVESALLSKSWKHLWED